MIIPLNTIGKLPREAWGSYDFVENLQKCGHVEFEFIPSGKIILWNLSILPEFRGQGLSAKLMEDIEQYIISNYPHIFKICLFVSHENRIAQKVYEKAGYRITKDGVRYAWAFLMSKFIEKDV